MRLDIRTRSIAEEALVSIESDKPLTVFLAECRDCNVTHPELIRALQPIRFFQPMAPEAVVVRYTARMRDRQFWRGSE